MSLKRTLSKKSEKKWKAVRATIVKEWAPGALLMKWSDLAEAVTGEHSDRKVRAVSAVMGFSTACIMLDDLDTLKDFIKTMPEMVDRQDMVRLLNQKVPQLRDYQLRDLCHEFDDQRMIIDPALAPADHAPVQIPNEPTTTKFHKKYD